MPTYFISFVFLLSFHVATHATNKYACNIKPDVSEVNHVRSLLEKIKPRVKDKSISSFILSQSRDLKIKSVNDFIGALPESMRKDFIVMTESRSVQNSSAKNPRIILKSPQSGVTVSFNLDPEHRAYDRVEITYFDPEQNKFIFTDVHFEGEGKNTTASSVHVNENPQSCVKCHQNNPRPNWDPYNFWHGQTPFNRDTLIRGSYEVDLYKSVLKRIENKEPRLQHLKPKITTADLKNMPNEIKILSSTGFDGPGVTLFDQLTKLNHCRISQDLLDNPNYEVFKFALMMAIQGCGFSDAFPEWAQDKMVDYWRNRLQISSNKDFDNIKRAVQYDTEKRQNRSIEEKTERQRLFFEKELKDPGTVGFEMSKLGLSNREDSLFPVSSMRVFLEPLGVDMKQWSMSLNPETYTFADLFDDIRETPAITKATAKPQSNEKISELSCEQLASMSKKAFEQHRAKIESQNHIVKPNCDPTELEKQLQTMLKTSTQPLIEKSAHGVFSKHGCVDCHTKGNIYGASEIPFLDPEKFKTFVKSYTGTLAGWDKIIWERINKPEADPDHMPQSAPVIRDPSELASVKAYLYNITNNSSLAPKVE